MPLPFEGAINQMITLIIENLTDSDFVAVGRNLTGSLIGDWNYILIYCPLITWAGIIIIIYTFMWFKLLS